MQTDLALLQLLREDPEQGMAQVLETFTGLVWAVAARYLPDEEDVRECVNDTFAELYFKLEKFDPEKGTLKTWLARIAQRRAIDRWRAVRGHTAQPLPSDEPTPGGGLAADDRLDLEAALAQLTEQEAALLRMKYFEGMSSREIAARLNLPYEAVKKRQQRTLKKLRRSMILALILALLALLAACGYALLRHFSILPGYGVNENSSVPFCTLVQPASASTGLGALTITDAFWESDSLTMTVQLERGPDAAGQVVELPDHTVTTLPWHSQLLEQNEHGLLLCWEGQQADCVQVATDVSKQTEDFLEFRLTYHGVYLTQPGGQPIPMTLDMGWISVDFAVQPAESEPLEAYSYAFAEYGGVLAVPSIEGGSLIVELYPLRAGEFKPAPGFTRTAYSAPGEAGAITATSSSGDVLVGEPIRYNPYSSDSFTRWDFGPAEPGVYTLDIPYLYVFATLPQDFSIPLPGADGCTYEVPGGAFTVEVEDGLNREGLRSPTGMDARPGFANYSVFFTPQEDPGLTFAALYLTTDMDVTEAEQFSDNYVSGCSVLYPESDPNLWAGMLAYFSPAALQKAPRLTATTQYSPNNYGSIVYRWDRSFELTLHVS